MLVKTISEVSLDKLIEYKNQNIIDKFLENFDVNEQEANVVFKDLMKWLWVNVEAKKQGFSKLYINHDLLIIDEMWHTFILFTKEYEEFCVQHFGYFLHHSPITKPEKERIEKEFIIDQKSFMEEKEKEMELVYEFIYDHLGNDVLNRWFLEYPKKYNAEQIHNLRKFLV